MDKMDKIDLDLMVEFFLACKMEGLNISVDKLNNYIIVNDYKCNNMTLNLEKPYVRIFIYLFTTYTINNIECNCDFFQMHSRIKHAYEIFECFDFDFLNRWR